MHMTESEEARERSRKKGGKGSEVVKKEKKLREVKQKKK